MVTLSEWVDVTWDPPRTSQSAWRHRWRTLWPLVSQTPTARGSQSLSVRYASPKQTHTVISDSMNSSVFCFPVWPHLPSSAPDCLDHHRVANLCSLGLQPLVGLVVSVVTTNDWHPSSWHDVFGGAEKKQTNRWAERSRHTKSCFPVFIGMQEAELRHFPPRRQAWTCSPASFLLPLGQSNWHLLTLLSCLKLSSCEAPTTQLLTRRNMSCECVVFGLPLPLCVDGTSLFPCLGWQKKVVQWRWCPPAYTPLQTLCFPTEIHSQGGRPSHTHTQNIGSVVWTMSTSCQRRFDIKLKIKKPQYHNLQFNHTFIRNNRIYKHIFTHMWSGLLGHLQNFLHGEVTLLGGWRTDVVGFIRLQHNHRKSDRFHLNVDLKLHKFVSMGDTEELQVRDAQQLTMATCMDCLSASLYTATVRTPIFLAERITRQAISPRLAISTFSILPTALQDKGETLTMIFFQENVVHYWVVKHPLSERCYQINTKQFCCPSPNTTRLYDRDIIKYSSPYLLESK